MAFSFELVKKRYQSRLFGDLTPFGEAHAFTFLKDKAFTWSLLSRRSRHMVGTRFFARGANLNGNVANFVETEQIVEFGDQVTIPPILHVK
jgi:hypothetical protein